MRSEHSTRRTRFATGRLLAVALVTVLAVTGTACASTGGGTDRYATIVVENDATMTVNVYSLRQGTRFRLGTVSGLSTRSLALKRHMISGGSNLQLLIDPVGSATTYPAQSILVNEGDSITLRVSNFIR